MPIKITNAISNPEEGLINQNDVNRIIDDFRNGVDIVSKSERQAIKNFTISFPLSEFMALIQNQPEDSRVNVQFGLTLPDQKSCLDNFQTDISNQLCVVINIAQSVNGVLTDNLNLEDFILAVGYKAFGEHGLISTCCGNPR